jgi:hypothetical protein
MCYKFDNFMNLINLINLESILSQVFGEARKRE